MLLLVITSRYFPERMAYELYCSYTLGRFQLFYTLQILRISSLLKVLYAELHDNRTPFGI